MSTNVSEQLRKLALNKLFHSETYHIRDGLDEYDGDYTRFEKLDPSIITADMKHLLKVEAEKLRAKQEKEESELLENNTGSMKNNDLEVNNKEVDEKNTDSNSDETRLEDRSSNPPYALCDLPDKKSKKTKEKDFS